MFRIANREKSRGPIAFLRGVRPFARLHCRGEIHAACVHSRRVADEVLVVHYCKAKPYKNVCVMNVVMPSRPHLYLVRSPRWCVMAKGNKVDDEGRRAVACSQSPSCHVGRSLMLRPDRVSITLVMQTQEFGSSLYRWSACAFEDTSIAIKLEILLPSGSKNTKANACSLQLCTSPGTPYLKDARLVMSTSHSEVAVTMCEVLVSRRERVVSAEPLSPKGCRPAPFGIHVP
jgi:hypothetical protein